MKIRQSYLNLIALLVSVLSLAQVYPVQLNSSVVPPYPSTISAYGTATSPKYLLNLFTADLNVVNRQVKLKIYIEGNGIKAQSTPVVNGAMPLFLNGGETLNLTNLDLEPYFRLENLQGISPQSYSEVLPQGSYNFCAEVFDFITNQKISKKSCTFYYFIYNEPPFLNRPTNHEIVQFQNPQNIIFSWTPRHINATNIEYKFELVELLNTQTPSNQAFLIGQPLYSTQTTNTVLHYDPSLPQLIEGRKYAWRVQALSQPGFGDKAVFNNNGNSEIFDFLYPGDCEYPKFVLATSANATQAKITWQYDPKHLDYVVEYRKKGSPQWFQTAHYNQEATLYDLEPGATYDFRVGGICMAGVTMYSNPSSFKQPTTNTAAINCGIQPQINLTNQTNFTKELPNDQVIMAGDFAIKLTEVTGTGTYTGKGYTTVPYLSSVKIGVEFKDIVLNTDFKLIKGEIKALYDPQWKNILDVGTIYDQIENVFDGFSPDVEEHNFSVDFLIEDPKNITVTANAITITSPDGQIKTFEHDPGELVIIKDVKGNTYTIDPEKGQVTQLAEGAGFVPNASNTEGVASNGTVTSFSSTRARVYFMRSSQSKFADDTAPANAHDTIQKLYKKLNDGNTSYAFYHKGIVNDGKGSKSTDFIDALIEINDSKIKVSDIVFNSNGVQAKTVGTPQPEGNKTRVTLEVPVFDSSTVVELMAIIKSTEANGKNKLIGASKIIPIKQLPAVNLTLIPVNGAAIPEDIETQLNALYKDAAVSFKVTKAKEYTITKNTLECGKDALLEKLSEDQDAFVKGYIKDNKPQKDEFYIFVTKGITPSRPIAGFMPRHSQFGFVFTDTAAQETKPNSNITSVMAHELGHGVFELEHPWEQYATGNKNSNTPWLMDYTAGTKLPYVHWQRISHPKFGVYVLDGSTKGEFSKCVMTPNFKIVNIEQSSIVLEPKDKNIPTGTVPGFVVIEKEKELISTKRFYYWDKDRYVNTSSLSWNSDKKVFVKIANTEPVFCVETKADDPEILFFLNLIDCPARKLFLSKSKLPVDYNTNKVLADFLASKLNASLPLECNPLDNSKLNQSLAGWTLAKDDSNVSCNIADEVVIQKQLLNIAESVNKPNNKIKDLEPIFKANITLCSMQKMEESLRFKILSKYFNEATDDSDLEISMCENTGCDYFFIKDLIKYTPENQQLNLLKKIRENNFEWIRKLYDFGSSTAGFGNDVEMNQVAEIYLEVSKWVIKYYDQLNVPLTVKQAFKFDNQPAISNYYPGMQPYILGKGNKDITLQIDNSSEINIQDTKLEFLENSRLRFYNQYMMTDLSPKIYDPNNPPSTASLYKYFDYNETYDPFEPITIICGIENQFGLEVKKEIVMPAIAAFAYQAVLQEESKEENLRQFGNAIMITTGVLATPFSGGTSLAGVLATISTVGVAVGSIDAYMTSVASADPSFKQSSFYKAWDTTYTTYSMIDGAGAVTNLAVTGYNILKLNNFAKSYNSFETAISGANTFQNSVFGERLNQLRNIFKNASTDLNLLNKGKTFSNYISKINTGFKKTFLATVLTLNLNVNATDNILQLSNNANKIETVLNLSGKTEQITDAIKSAITSKSDEIVKAFDNQSVVSIKTSPTAQAVDGKFIILNVGQDNILATLINNQIKINFVKAAVDGYHIYEYNEDKDPANNNTNPKCTFCPDKIGNTKESELCKKLEQLASNTQNSTAVHKLCAKGIDIAVLNKVLALTTAKQKVFVDDFGNVSDEVIEVLKKEESAFNAWKKYRETYTNRVICN